MIQNNTNISNNQLREMFNKIIDQVETHAKQRASAYEVEKNIFKELLKLGLQILIFFFQECNKGDQAESITLTNGKTLKRLPKVRNKPYQTIFGEITIQRTAYAQGEKQKMEIPLDKQLQLPAHKDSYLLQEWQQSLAQKMPYQEVQDTLILLLDFYPSSHTVQRGTQKLSQAVSDYEDTKPAITEAQRGEMVVTTVDGKGVPMRSGGKKMALVGCGYTIAPHERSVDEVMAALFDDGEKREQSLSSKRPLPIHKQLHTSLLRDQQDSMQPSMDAMFDVLEKDYRQRDQSHHKPHILLADGQQSLWNEMARRFGHHSNNVEILDLLHATGYIWEAMPLLTTDEAQQNTLAYDYIERLLKGKVDEVIIELEMMADSDELTKSQQKKLNSICGYFRNNKSRMRYDQYLKAGYPIASGVIEGACRHVVKDRMERSGMRWTLAGAEALLSLRCIDINKEWESYMSFYMQQENERLYSMIAANDDDFTISQPLAA